MHGLFWPEKEDALPFHISKIKVYLQMTLRQISCVGFAPRTRHKEARELTMIIECYQSYVDRWLLSRQVDHWVCEVCVCHVYRCMPEDTCCFLYLSKTKQKKPNFRATFLHTHPPKKKINLGEKDLTVKIVIEVGRQRINVNRKFKSEHISVCESCYHEWRWLYMGTINRR